MTTQPSCAYSRRIGGPRYAVRLIHLSAGWRYWAFERGTGADEAVGLDPNGYPTEEAAQDAIRRITGENR